MTSSAAPVARSAARSAPRTAKRRKTPQRRTPEHFFDAKAYALLKTLLIEHARRWQTEGQPAIYVYGNNSDPLWGEDAQQPCSGSIIRIMQQDTLSHCLGMDLERSLRLLTLAWTPERRTAEGHRSLEEWQRALSGCLWRVGQLYREFKRRNGADAARRALEAEMSGLYQPETNRIYRWLCSLSLDATPDIERLSAYDMAHIGASAPTP